MPLIANDGKEIDPSSRVKYRDRFDYVINHIALEAFGENDIVSGLLVTATYLHMLRVAAADAGMTVGINPYEAAKIFLIFEALKFERQRTLMDKLLRRKKDIENIHITMCNTSTRLYMEPNSEIMFDWGAAYLDCFNKEFELTSKKAVS